MVHVKPKRPLVPVPFLQAIIDEIVTAQTEEALTIILDRFESPHHFERPEERNLLSWFKVLNRFDELLESYIISRNIFSSKKSSIPQTLPAPTTTDNPSALPAPTSTAAADTSGTPPSATPTKHDAPTAAVSDKAAATFTPSPGLVRKILRLTQRLLRNSSHDTRTVYNSVEHIGSLLADDNCAIVLLALEILNMLMQRSHKLRSSRTHITFELSERLLDMATGLGGRENRLGMLECCSSKHANTLPSDGSRLYFEYVESLYDATGLDTEPPAIRVDCQPENRAKTASASLNSRLVVGPIPIPISEGEIADIPVRDQPSVSWSAGSSAIVLDNVGEFQGNEQWILDFASNNHVPKGKWFALLSAFRRAKRFSEGRDARIELTIIRLYAITTLFQVQPFPSALNDLLSKEPELLQDIVALASASADDGVDDIPLALRIIAISCLTAMSSDRHRVESIMSATGVSAHHGALPTLLRTEISSLLASATPSCGIDVGEKNHFEAMNTDSDPAFQPRSENRVPRNATRLTLLAECNRSPLGIQRIHMTEALLSLVLSLALAAGSSGATPLANSGVLGILIPLLADRDMRHSRVVAHAIRAMQAIVEGSAQALGCQLFRDHDGLNLIAERIATEVGIEDPEVSPQEQKAADEAAETEALHRRGESRALYARLGERQMTPLEALENPPPSSGAASRGQLPHSKWALLRALHTLLLRSLGNGGSEVRELVVSSKLSRALRKIMGQPFLHGGSLFYSAASVTTEIAHAEPTATTELFRAGLAATVLNTVSLGLPPCAEAIRCIPSLLAALCLAPSARDMIVSAKPLKSYLLRLSTPFYTRALHGESPVHIGGALDELMRHVEALRPDGNSAMIEYLKLSARFVAAETRGCRRPSRVGNSATHTAKEEGRTVSSDKVDKSSQSTASSAVSKGDQERSSPDAILLDKMKLAVANNSGRLAGFAQGSTEHQEGIVQNGGLDHMIQLRLAPALACTEASVREGYSFSRHYPTPAMTVVSLVSSLRNFSSRHAASVLRALFAVILKDAARVLKISKEMDDAWLPQEDDAVLSKEFSANNTAGAQEQTVTGEESENSKGTRDGTVDTPNTGEVGALSEKRSQRSALRKKLCEALKQLRVGVVLLSGLSRGGPGTSAGVWETARGSQVASIVSTVERAARYHLAIVYTGLTLNASSDGDLSTARVTAAADPELKSLRADSCNGLVGDLNKTFGRLITSNSMFKDACQRYKVPPETHEPVRQEVKGLAWCLVTFAVAAQRLYSTLAKGLTFSSRRLSRDPARYAASARSLAESIGRIFVLHLMAAEKLWNVNVITMGDKRVLAAWDFIRGIVIEIKGTLFDESRRGTQSLILRTFLEAGGAEALLQATKPFRIVQAASRMPCEETGKVIGLGRQAEDELDKILQSNALSVSSFLLALSDISSHLQVDERNGGEDVQQAGLDSRASGAEKEDTVMSTDSVSNQARAISRIMVSEPGSHKPGLAGLADKNSTGDDLLAILSNSSEVASLKEQTARARDLAFQHCKNVSVRRVASDVWNTLCGFLHLLGSCPGLLNSGSTLPDVPGSGSDWEPRDLQRSALTVTLEMLQTVTKSPNHLLSSFNPEGSAMGDILAIVHTTSQVAEDLCPKNNAEDTTRNIPESDVFQERHEEVPPPRSVSPDPEMLRSLVEMGFSERRAAAALRHTAPGGIEYATEWLLTHAEEDEDSEDSDENADVLNWEGENDGADGERDREDQSGDDDEVDEDDENDNQDDVENVEECDMVAVANGDREAPGNGEMEEIIQDDAMSDDGTANAIERRDSGQARAESSRVNRQRRGGARPRAMRARVDTTKGEHSSEKEKLALEREGPRLVTYAMRTELDLLSAALEKSKMVQSGEVAQILALAAAQFDPTSKRNTTVSPGKDSATGALQVTSITTDSFQMSKKQLFQSLLDVTEAVILKSESHTHGRYLPYFAVELLSIVQKDSSMLKEGTDKFASLLDEGLRVALNEQKRVENSMTPGLRGQTTVVWSHYGGNHARRALQSCGTFELAYDRFLNVVAEWTGASKTPLVDVEATQTIKELSIREDKAVTTPKPGLTSVSKIEAQWLKQLTTCLLLLDAMVRYGAKDRIIQRTTDVGKPKEDDSGALSKKECSNKGDRMEMDKNIETGGEKIGSHTARNVGDGTTDSDPLEVSNAVMRDVVGTASAMDIDAKSSADENVDLEELKSSAEATKSKVIDEAKKSIAAWMTNGQENVIPTRISKKLILQNCVALLGLWNHLEVGDAMLAVLQLIGSLTAEWPLAEVAICEGIVPLLLGLPHLESGQSISTDFKVVRLLTKTILRHLMEDPKTLEEAMSSELRVLLSGGQSRARPAFSVRSLVMSTSPMAARDMQCYIAALTQTVRFSESQGRGEIQLVDSKPKSSSDIELLLLNRRNVTAVISALSNIISNHYEHPVRRDRAQPQSLTPRGRKTEVFRLSKYALELISEFVEFSQVAAVAFINCVVPTGNASCSALDFVIEKVLALPDPPSDSRDILSRMAREREELSNAARNLFLALCSKTANTHQEAVTALARAVRLEADRKNVRAGIIAALAQCIMPGTKLRVLQVVLESGMANDLARSLRNLELGIEKNFEVAMYALRALSLIGQAATHLARHGNESSADVSFGSSSRDPWSSLRDREDTLGHASSYMVL